MAFTFPLAGGLANELFEVGFFKIGFREELAGEEGLLHLYRLVFLDEKFFDKNGKRAQ